MKEREEALAVNEEESLELNQADNKDGDYSSEATGTKEFGEGKAGSDVENKDPNTDRQQYGSLNEKKQKQKHKRRNTDSDSYSYSSSERKELLLSDFITFTKPNKTKGNKGAVSSKGCHDNNIQKEEQVKNDHIVFVDQDSDLSLRNHGAISCDENLMLETTTRSDDDDDINLDSGYQKSDSAQKLHVKGGQGVGNEQHKGTEIRFKALELSENTATLSTDSIALTMECLKCKTRIDAKLDKTRLVAFTLGTQLIDSLNI